MISTREYLADLVAESLNPSAPNELSEEFTTRPAPLAPLPNRKGAGERDFPLDEYLEMRRLLAESDKNGGVGE